MTQTRTFSYSDAGLLTSATNPENGTVTYTYNADNTLQYKHDAKGQDTVYTYDTQKRVTMIQKYPSGRNNAENTCERVQYTYDTNPVNGTFSQNSYNRLTTKQYSVCASSHEGHTATITEMYSYNPAGQVTAKQFQAFHCGYDADSNWTCGTAPINATYTYDALGQVSSLNGMGYGSDSLGRHVSLTDPTVNDQTGNARVWAQNATYDAGNRLTQLDTWYGIASQSFEYLHDDGSCCDVEYYYEDAYNRETRAYNTNGQLASLGWAGVPVTGQYWDGGPWAPSYGPLVYNYSTSANNGRITSMKDGISNETVTYTYDALKRLTAASSVPKSEWSSPAAWTQTFAYDGFGNMTSSILNGTTMTIGVNGVRFGDESRILPGAPTNYDYNGNMTSGIGMTMQYDVANRLAQAQLSGGGTEYYGYAPDNKRIYRYSTPASPADMDVLGSAGRESGDVSV